MGLIAKAALCGTVALAVGAGIIGWRTYTFSAGPKSTPAEAIQLASPLAIDANASAARLSAAIRFRTVSNQDPATNDWSQWDGFHAWLKTAYPRFHAAAKLELADGRTLVYRWEGSDPSAKPIILMAHQDVVPVAPGTEKDWKKDPFSGEISDGAVWGRGAIDDKGSLIALFEAMEALAVSGFKPKRTIYLVSGHDEEVGGDGARAAAKLLQDRGVHALFTLDEGSLIVKDPPIVNKPTILIGIAEKGYATLKVTAKGAGGHSSMPPKEIATVNLARAVAAINDKQFPYEFRGPGADMVRALGSQTGGMTKVALANQWLFGSQVIKQVSASPSGAAMLHTTIAPTMLSGSPKENVLPQEATALINYRIAPWQSSKEVMAWTKSAVGDLPVTLSWEGTPREPSPISSTDSEGWRLVSAAAQAEMPGAPLAPFLVIAGTDSRNFTGISDDVYRFAPVRLATTETAMIHGTNEHIAIDDLGAMIRFFTRLITTAA